MKAVLTRAAVSDLAEIARHIGRDSVPAARRFTASLERRALAVGRNPNVFPYAEGLENLKIRRRLYRDYLIFFIAHEAGVEILRIVHGSWRTRLESFVRRSRSAVIVSSPRRAVTWRYNVGPRRRPCLTQGFCIIFP